jgi:hypothetical protein
MSPHDCHLGPNLAVDENKVSVTEKEHEMMVSMVLKLSSNHTKKQQLSTQNTNKDVPKKLSQDRWIRNRSVWRYSCTFCSDEICISGVSRKSRIEKLTIWLDHFVLDDKGCLEGIDRQSKGVVRLARVEVITNNEETSHSTINIQPCHAEGMVMIPVESGRLGVVVDELGDCSIWPEWSDNLHARREESIGGSVK